MGQNIEQEVLAILLVIKLREPLKIATLKAPRFVDRKSQYFDDIIILTGGTEIREEVSLSLDKTRKEILGYASKVIQ
ncbi:hypothetical protein VNO77_31220 [Canavalia gladiata]|uniref:Uncharacterized protein n=1 Tax=Canavalia gladiata TaxID=3824 RepID=A0AAN9Q7M1_CANGL